MSSNAGQGGGEIHFNYDDVGNVTMVSDPRGARVTYIRDDLGRVVEEQTFATLEQTEPSRSVQYSYSMRGDLAGYSDGDKSAVYAFDASGRMTSSSIAVGSFDAGIAYAYYRNGLVRSFTAPDGVVYQYEYDAANRLRAVDLPGEGKITYGAYLWHLPLEVSFPGGALEHYAYDDYLRPTRFTARDPSGNVVIDQAYTWNLGGQLEQRTTGDDIQSYAYDSAYQMTSVEGASTLTESFMYDDAGNRLPSEEEVETSFQYSVDNELLSTNAKSYSYDAAGNVQTETSGSEVTRRFYFDEQSQLVRIEGQAGNTVGAYGYDPFGRRLWKETNGVRKYFYYAGEGLVAELDASGGVSRSFGYKPAFAQPNPGPFKSGAFDERVGAPERLQNWTTAPLFTRDTDYSYYHNDHLGVPQMLTNAGGTVVWSARYSGYGVAEITNQTVPNLIRLPGQYHDDESGLSQNWHRYYDPDLGRYISADPLPWRSQFNGSRAALFSDLNLFRYAFNDPQNRFDVSGLDSCVLAPRQLFLRYCGSSGEPGLSYITKDVPPPPSTGKSDGAGGCDCMGYDMGQRSIIIITETIYSQSRYCYDPDDGRFYVDSAHFTNEHGDPTAIPDGPPEPASFPFHIDSPPNPNDCSSACQGGPPSPPPGPIDEEDLAP